MKKIILLLFICFLINASFSHAQSDLTKYVDPFIGTEGGGNVFPGTCLPFGMVKLGPDCEPLTSNSGYTSESPIKGFSQTHVSGTGGGPKYGNVLVCPIVGDINLEDYSSPRDKEMASVGYYYVELTRSDIEVELTASHSVGFHRYTFPKSNESKILIDLGSVLELFWCDGCSEEQKLVGSEIEVVNDTLIEGYTRVRHGWNEGDAYTVYFSAIFDTPAKSWGTWKENEKRENNKVEYDSGEATGAWFTFNTEENQKIQVKVGISFLGRTKARQNIKEEISHWNFNNVKQITIKKWMTYLNRIQAKTSDENLKTIFYTALYHSILQPTDRNGENPLWASIEPYYDDFYAIWDTYRATHPLFIFLCPEKQVEIVNALLNIYDHEGYMPDARSGNHTGRTQGGSNCDVLIADAFVKGLEGIDYEKGLEAMIKNAEVDPGDDHQMKGRGGLLEYNTLGYVSPNHERAGSRTVEYAYNDYCIYLVAKGLGKDSLAAKYLKRSENWKNLWKNVEDSGAKGFIMPRKADGTWDEDYKGRAWSQETGWHPAKFTVHNGGTWSDFFYEADSWEYSFYAPHDLEGLIEKCGGEKAFVARLDTFFTKGYFSVSNEPSFLTPVLYNYAQRQDKTSDVIRHIISNAYNTTRRGIPGNDDSGSMSSWVAFNLMGFFPNAGQNLYLITSPHFEQVSIDLTNNKKLEIITHNLSSKNVYIQKVLLNKKPLKRAWFRHDEIKNGGTLEFYMGKKPNNKWEEQLP